MIRINLLPHREMKRAARQRRFLFLSLAAASLGAVLVVLIYTFNEGRIEEQEGRNKLLTAEIKKLDDQIEEIKKIKAGG